MNAVQRSTVVNAPIGSVYRQWLRLEDLPKFISAVKQVKKLDAKHFFIAVFHKGKRCAGVSTPSVVVDIVLEALQDVPKDPK
jgi:hypothetical protein